MELFIKASNYKTIVISAPSATGKTTLLRKLIAKNSAKIEFAITCTTRKKRDSEIHGKDYLFLSKENFEKDIQEDKFLEWALVHGNYYGSSVEVLNKIHQQNKKAILIIDVQGWQAAKRKVKDAISVFIMPPNAETLKQRMDKRGGDDLETKKKRMESALYELSHVDSYDYFIINENIDRALLELELIVIEEKPAGITKSHARQHAQDLCKNIGHMLAHLDSEP